MLSTPLVFYENEVCYMLIADLFNRNVGIYILASNQRIEAQVSKSYERHNIRNHVAKRAVGNGILDER